ncbi:amidase signature enzyme [Meredithblackwellia eburnea MCA 4105]
MPATMEDVQAAAARLKFTVPVGHEQDYLTLLNATEKAAETLLAIPAYYTPLDTDRFPRKDVHNPDDKENPLKGWGWKVTIEGTKDGILKGKTAVAKDTVCVGNVPLLFGTNAFKDYIPTVDATVITRILENGGTFIGKATCENFSHGASSFSSPFGPVQNPYAHGFSTGGSSSGCGALIGSGAADMGIGGDQGGSIRIPASLCGIVGLKPTYGLVPYTGVLSSDTGVDHVGPMARNVLDTALLLQAIAGYDDIDDRQLGAPLPCDVPKYGEIVLKNRSNKEYMKGIRIAVLKEGFENKALDPNVEASVRAAIEGLKKLGAVVEEVSVPLHLNGGDMSHIINKYASSQTRQGRQVGRRGLYLVDYWKKLLPWTQEKYDLAKYYVTGTSMSAEFGWSKYPTVYGHAMNLSRRLRDEYNEVLSKYDAVVMPTVMTPARRHVAPESGPLAWTQSAPGITANTSASNLTGHPTISIPCGFTPPSKVDILSPEDEKIKLPCGMMFMGKIFQEETILSIADAWEQAYDWKSL